MNEDDSKHVAIIKEAKGWDFSTSYQRQRQAWDPLAEEMYKAHRKDYGPMNWQGR